MASKIEWLLLAMAEADGGSLSPVQVQKTLFVFREGARSLPAESVYDFVPYNYGPFNREIYAHLYELQAKGLVHIINPASGAQRRYAITPLGIAATNQIREADTLHASFMRDVVQWVQRHSFPDLVRAIYQRWPEYRRNSVFVDAAEA